MRHDQTLGEQQAITPQQFKKIQSLAENIQYGSITLIFQDGILIQIEKSEKIRLPKTENG